MYPTNESLSSPVALYKLVTDLQLRVVDANELVQQTTKRRLPQIVGIPVQKVLPFLNVTQTAEIRSYCSTHPSRSYKLEVQWMLNGTIRYLNWMVCSVLNSTGDPDGLQWIGVETTQTKLKSKASNVQQIVLEHISDALIMRDEHLVVTSFNKRAEQIFGLSAQQIIGRKLADFYTVRPTVETMDMAIQSLRKKGSWKGTVEWVCKRGQIIYTTSQVFQIKNEDGQVCGYVSIDRDYTDQYKLQQNHKEQATVKTLLEEIMDQTGALAWATDVEGRKRYMNATFRKVFRVGEDAVPHRMTELFVEGHMHRLAEQNSKVIKEGAVLNQIEETTLPDGREVKYRTLKFPVQTQEGVFAAGFAFNVTNEIRREEELNYLKIRFEKAAKILADVIGDWDIDQDLLWRSDPEHEIDVHPTRASSMKDRFERLHPEDLPAFQQSLQNAMESGADNWECEYRYKSWKNPGGYKILYERSVFLRNEAGKAVRMISVVQDVTEKRRLQNELEEKKRAVTKATIAGQEAERSELARELHDNVGQILAMCKLFVDITSDAVQHEYLEKCREHLQQAISEIRNLSHRLSPETLVRKGLFSTIAEMVEHINQTGKLLILHNSCPNLDKVQLPQNVQIAAFRVVQECFNNILKHAAATEASVHYCLGDHQLTIEVKDNGKGFDPEIIHAGIGLKNIRDRIEANDGRITLISAPGKGCTIRIELPLVPEETFS